MFESKCCWALHSYFRVTYSMKCYDCRDTNRGPQDTLFLCAPHNYNCKTFRRSEEGCILIFCRNSRRKRVYVPLRRNLFLKKVKLQRDRRYVVIPVSSRVRLVIVIISFGSSKFRREIIHIIRAHSAAVYRCLEQLNYARLAAVKLS